MGFLGVLFRAWRVACWAPGYLPLDGGLSPLTVVPPNQMELWALGGAAASVPCEFPGPATAWEGAYTEPWVPPAPLLKDFSEGVLAHSMGQGQVSGSWPWSQAVSPGHLPASRCLFLGQALP